MRMIDLRETVPWGRTYDEYVAMFALGEEELRGRILDCGAGPASFAAEAVARGGHVVACDPLYRFGASEIEERFEEVAPEMLARTVADRDLFVWTFFESPEANVEHRRLAMTRFAADMPAGLAAGRYVCASLPGLPFADDAFDLAVSSHLLFLYASILSLDFHLAAMRELLRVAPEVRVFPLQDLEGRPSAHLDPLIAELSAEGHRFEVRPVEYEYQRGASRMLVAKRAVA